MASFVCHHKSPFRKEKHQFLGWQISPGSDINLRPNISALLFAKIAIDKKAIKRISGHSTFLKRKSMKLFVINKQ
jgi:hypothetical protein